MDKILTLLQVVNLAKQWPQLQALHDVAMQDLLKESIGAKQELADRAKVAAEEADKAKPVDETTPVTDIKRKV